MGILNAVKSNQEINLSEKWYDRLGKWEDALEIYEQKQIQFPLDPTYLLGRMKCLVELGEYNKVYNIAKHTWYFILTKHNELKEEMANLTLRSLLNLIKYDEMQTYITEIDENTVLFVE